MKKKIALLLALVLAFTAVMTGCGKKAAYKADNGEEYHIKWFASGTKSQDHDMVFEEISKYTKEKINATVEQTLIPRAEYDESIQRLFYSGEEMDLVYASQFPNYVSDGIYQPLDELLRDHGQDILNTLPDYAWQAVSVDGQIYGVPPLKDWGVHYVLQYFDGLVEKYNMDFSNVKELKDLEIGIIALE